MIDYITYIIDIFYVATSKNRFFGLCYPYSLTKVRVAVSRSLSVAHMSANLRRALHDDLAQSSFRSNIGRYLESFSELVSERWETFRELQTFTTGHNLDIMFADRSRDAFLIQAAMPEPDKTSTKEGRDQLAHFMTVTRKGGYYMYPQSQSVDGTVWACFQLLGFNPGNRKYMERLTQWSVDNWRNSLSCAVLGTFLVPPDHGGSRGMIVPGDISFSFKSVNTVVQPLLLRNLFVNDVIDSLHEFTVLSHKTEFDKQSVQDLLLEPILDETVDEALASFVSSSSAVSFLLR